MNAKYRRYCKRLLAGIALLIAIILTVSGQTNFAKAQMDNDDLMLEIRAGVANITEVESPTDAEVAEALVRAQRQIMYAEGALVMANVNESVNMRAEPDEESDRVGKMYNDCGGYILEYTDTWTYLKSGNAVGWVRNDYLLFGQDAEELANSVGSYQATITTQTLRVRKDSTTDSEIWGLIAEGDVYEVVEEDGDWCIIDFEGEIGYINKEYTDIAFVIDYGESMDEIEAREAAEAAAEEARRQAAASSSQTHQQQVTSYGSYAATASDVVLLGALIQCEAGTQPYEGQQAVGAVVMNRVRSAAYPNSLYSVIFASGQFSVAGSGAVDRCIARGVSQSCLNAAQSALDGYSNVGSATHFRPTRSGHAGIVIAGHVFW